MILCREVSSTLTVLPWVYTAEIDSGFKGFMILSVCVHLSLCLIYLSVCVSEPASLSLTLCLPLQAAVLQQDSLLELCQRGCSLPGGVAGGERGRDKLSRSLSRDGGLDAALGGGTELVLLQRQHSLIQEELSRTRGSEARLRDSERARAENERQLRELREHSAALQAKLDILQGKEADKRPRHSRQNSLPNEGELRQGSAGQVRP